MHQIPLRLDLPVSFAAEDFVVTPCNQMAFQLIQAPLEQLRGNTILITGPVASGKSHIASIWAETHNARLIHPETLGKQPSEALFPKSKAIVVEAIELCDRDGLFHLLQFLQNHKDHFALLTSSEPLRNLWPQVPDIHSRLNLATPATLEEPDDILIQALLTKGFSDRQLKVESNVIQYLLPRMERSCVAINQLLEQLDRAALQEKRAITLPLVRRVLENLQDSREN